MSWLSEDLGRVGARDFGLHRDGFATGIVEPVPEPGPRVPRIGLALGGGAARGWSHIGVIEALEEAGIPIGIVSGCSIGAVVGGCHAAGELGALTEFARSLTKRRVMGLLDLRLGSGLIAGDRLRQRLERDLGDRRIEALPVRFASVATELGTGHEVWLTRGSLVDAVRASYALPGIFPPVRLGARLLMDGTLVNPVPVRLARAMGAEVVICVNLNCDPRVRGTIVEPEAAELVRAEPATLVTKPRRRWPSLRGIRGGARLESLPRQRSAPGLARVMLDAFNITQDRISRARLDIDPPDLTISPQLAGMGLFEFHRAAEAIDLGRQAARAALPQIHAMIASATARV